ncbi:uncharacterized protein BO80DRAFT_424350 [Aspergillus ibericus CBS 121593]|uniref:Uncharacterized protein n=1 Tax=Aspergillus ibericus CBS 121593 TaxID=1448316 RepID=A0A395H3G8_9EURO|nr:hypothetical protein BO80DRAFT_424350 [Aspergillus ibericus CBS 121593]RAL01979.1 hypothetical protein BO80DRAFT_424350 [Aspergillus ibericus CBS 121593]
MRGALYQPVEMKPIDLVIDDQIITRIDGRTENAMDRAIRILRDAGFPDGSGPDPSNLRCPIELEKLKTYPMYMPPRFKTHHSFHLRGELQAGMHQELRLYRKSEYFWCLLNVKPSAWMDDGDVHSDFMLACDSRLTLGDQPGQGRFAKEHRWVQIPKPVRYIEALLLLMITHGDTANRQNYWRTEILVLQLNVPPWMFKDEDFHPRVRAWWEVAKKSNGLFVTQVQWEHEKPHLEELARALRQEGPLRAPNFSDLYLPA